MRQFMGLLSLCIASSLLQASEVTVSLGKQHAEFRYGGRVVGIYQFGPHLAKPVIWPLLAPNGVPVTNYNPIDHVHHKSAWFCHGDVIPEGLELKDKPKGLKGVDFWSEHAGHGKILCTRAVLTKETSKPGAAAISTQNVWQTADGVKILDESRAIRLSSAQGGLLWVFDIELIAKDYPITFGDTKEGAFAVRVHEQLEGKKGSIITNAEGKTGEKAVWGYQSKWCDYSGKVDGQAVGVAIFDDPKNRSTVAWHSREYGLMGANPFGREGSKFPALKGKTDLIKLGKGEGLKLRYGLFVHTGDVKSGKVGEAYEEFVQARP